MATISRWRQMARCKLHESTLTCSATPQAPLPGGGRGRDDQDIQALLQKFLLAWDGRGASMNAGGRCVHEPGEVQ